MELGNMKTSKRICLCPYLDLSTKAAMAVSEAVGETSAKKMKSLETFLVTSSKELINIPNIFDFAAFENLSTKRSLSEDLWILSSGCYKRNEPMG